MEKYASQKRYRAENMTTVSARFSNDFVNKFKAYCKELNVSQADIIRKAMEDTIMNANTQLINELLLNPTKENVSHFLESRDGEAFMLRDFEETKMEIVKSRYSYKHCEFSCSEKDLLNDIINNPTHDNFYANDNTMWSCFDDEHGENGYSISETDLWYNLIKWKDGSNEKDVYIFK